MIVHTCVISSLQGDKVEMLNDQGCALDRFILNNLEYPSDLNAGQVGFFYYCYKLFLRRLMYSNMRIKLHCLFNVKFQ